MPIFPKNTSGFQMNKGNKPSFQQMRSSPPKMYDAPGKMYAPLKDNTANINVDNTEEEEEEIDGTKPSDKETKTTKAADGTEVEVVEDEEVDDTKKNVPPDKAGTKAFKIGLASLMGGMDEVYGTETKTPKVNNGKVVEEVAADTPETKVDKLIGKGEIGPKTKDQSDAEKKEADEKLKDNNNDGMPDYMLVGNPDDTDDDPSSTNNNNNANVLQN